MKIAMITEQICPWSKSNSFDAKDQNIYMGQLAQQLALAGHDVHIFVRKEHPELSEISILHDNLRFVRIPLAMRPVLDAQDVISLVHEYADSMQQYCLQMSEPYDLIHTDFWIPAIVALQLKEFLNIPFVMTFHSLGKIDQYVQPFEDEFTQMRVNIEEEIAQQASRVIVQCPRDKFDLCQLYGVDFLNISSIPCGFNPIDFGHVCRVYQEVSSLKIHSDSFSDKKG